MQFRDRSEYATTMSWWTAFRNTVIYFSSSTMRKEVQRKPSNASVSKTVLIRTWILTHISHLRTAPICLGRSERSSYIADILWFASSGKFYSRSWIYWVKIRRWSYAPTWVHCCACARFSFHRWDGIVFHRFLCTGRNWNSLFLQPETVLAHCWTEAAKFGLKAPATCTGEFFAQIILKNDFF